MYVPVPRNDWKHAQDGIASKNPVAELKSLFKKKGAAGFPQGLLDDFIRVTTPSADGDGAGTGGGVTLEEFFRPVRGMLGAYTHADVRCPEFLTPRNLFSLGGPRARGMPVKSEGEAAVAIARY